MAATPATIFFVEMAKLVGNLGGAIESLPNVDLVSGKTRKFVANLALATQINGAVLGVARVPLPFVMTGITLLTDTSLGSSTIKLGNAGNGNSAIYLAAQTFTAVNTPTGVGNAATQGVEINSGFDSVTGLATGYASSSGFGAAYEDITLTIGAANFPASGIFKIIFEYQID